MVHIPNLVDPIQVSAIQKIINKAEANSKQLGGFLGFLSDKNRDSLSITFVLIFFIILLLFLYFRFREKKENDKKKSIGAFVQSVDSYLYNPYSYNIL